MLACGAFCAEQMKVEVHGRVQPLSMHHNLSMGKETEVECDYSVPRLTPAQCCTGFPRRRLEDSSDWSVPLPLEIGVCHMIRHRVRPPLSVIEGPGVDRDN